MAKKKFEVEKGKGFIWANDKTADNQPDFVEEMINLDGKKVEATIWIKKTANGKPYALLKLQDAVEAEHERHEYRMAKLQGAA